MICSKCTGFKKLKKAKKNVNLFDSVIKHKIKIILAVLLLFHFFTHLFWINNNHLVSYEEDQEHVQKFLVFFKNLNNSQENFFGFFNDIRSKGSYWPVVRSPFLYLSTALVSCVVGFSYFKLRVIFFIFFIVIVLSTYYTAKKIANDKVGVFAAFFISFLPMVFHYVHIYNVDLPLAAMVALTLYLVIDYCDNQSDKNMLKLGIVCGLGMLTKPSFIFFTIFPLIYYWVFIILKENRRQPRNVMDIKGRITLDAIKKLLVFLIPFLVLSWIWYGQKIEWALASFVRESFNKEYSPAFSFAGVLFYPVHFYKYNGTVISLTVVLAVIKVFKTEFKNKKLLFLWLLFSYLALFFLSNKQLRFSLPLLPVVAVIVALGAQYMWHKRGGKYLLFCFGLFLILQFFYLSFFYQDGNKKYNMLFSSWHIPPQRFWATERGRNYLSFFDKIIFTAGNQKEICDKIPIYYNYTAFVKPDKNDKDPVSLDSVFTQYLITKKSWLLVNCMSNIELFHLFIHNRFYFISDENGKNCWPNEKYIIKKLSLDRFDEFNIKNKLVARSLDEVVFIQKGFLPPNMYQYWYEK